MINPYLVGLLAVISILSVGLGQPETTCKNSRYILQKSQEKYDPGNFWDEAELAIHIQEPRLNNPRRFSVLNLNNKTGAFGLTRDSEVGEVVRTIDEEGNASVTLNGSSEIDQTVVDEYRLGAERNFGYHSFYRMMYGLPMSIKEQIWLDIHDAETTTLGGREVYKIRVELEQAMISKYWELMIAAEDFSLVALKFDHSDDSEQPDEIIKFGGGYSFQGITIPRFRHWYHMESGEYRGSDIILKEIEDS